MRTIVLKYGLISGGVLAAMTAIMTPLCLNQVLDVSSSEVLGYTTMVLAFILVFFGIRSYRETVGGGTVSFGKAFQVGILISLITCAVYVVSWEIVYYNFIPDFADRYAAISLQKMQARGTPPEKLAEARQEMERFKVMYKNPLYNAGMTFMEVFPVGLVVTLVSAAILRRKTPPMPAAAAVA